VAETTFTVVECTKTGIPDISVHASHVDGTTITNADYGRIPNDGKVVLLVDAVAADTFTFTPVLDKYGRTETLAVPIVITDFGIIGPFNPEIWNQADGCVIFKLTTGGAVIMLAVRVGTPT